jgi:hypothetical protein
MKRRYVLLLACTVVPFLLCLCQGAKKTNIAKVGMTTLTQNDLDAFNTLARYFPQEQGEFSLLSRNANSAFVETEAIFQKSRWNLGTLAIRRNPDWVWKTRYFISLNFVTEILQRNLGFSDAQLKRYYEANKSQFKAIEKYDSAGKPVYAKTPKSFIDAKNDISKKLFLNKYKADSTVYKGAKTKADSSEALDRWADYIRERGHRDFFMNIFYKEKFGKKYPDSLKDIYGKKNYITPAEMDIILSWIPADRRDQFKGNQAALMDFAGWLARWKLFSEKAKSSGFASQPLTRDLLKWAWKIEIAQRYVNKRLAPAAKKGISLDTAMLMFSCMDENGRMLLPTERKIYTDHLAQVTSQLATVKFDSLIYQIRKSKHIRFLASKTGGPSDERSKDPAKLMSQADALRDTGKTSEAQALYQTLVSDFAFTKEGKKALVELAKIQTEQQAYNDAIKNYRRFLVIDADKSKECNNMFMIGFIYDEYLDRPEMAELNYKWVLKNAPECELADDAEFMMLHLGEQMASVDELQAEVKRQGKKVEASAAGEQELNVETEKKAEPAKK